MSLLVVVVGPTATGKSALAVRIAKALRSEVISADSMQVYRGFDIGTGKATKEERSGVRHHLIDVVDPAERFSAARFSRLAEEAIAAIEAKGRIPVVAGGTGLYVRALLNGLFDAPPHDPEIRAHHGALRDRAGVGVLYARLQAEDPLAAGRIMPNDFVRISRALEVLEQTGVPISELHAGHGFAERRHHGPVIGINPGRELLRQRIEARVDAMIAAGWLDEVRHLIEAGHAQSHPMGALGYRQLSAHLRGELDFDEALRQTKRDTWRFAKRQINWYRSESDVTWVSGLEAVDIPALVERISNWSEPT